MDDGGWCPALSAPVIVPLSGCRRLGSPACQVGRVPQRLSLGQRLLNMWASSPATTQLCGRQASCAAALRRYFSRVAAAMRSMLPTPVAILLGSSELLCGSEAVLLLNRSSTDLSMLPSPVVCRSPSTPTGPRAPRECTGRLSACAPPWGLLCGCPTRHCGT